MLWGGLIDGAGKLDPCYGEARFMLRGVAQFMLRFFSVFFVVDSFFL